MSGLLLVLHRLGSQFFGRSNFVARSLATLDNLAPNDEAVFLNRLGISLPSHLWLPSFGYLRDREAGVNKSV